MSRFIYGIQGEFMLVIRDEQIAALARSVQESFLLQTVKKLEAWDSERGYPATSEERDRFVRLAIQRAKGYGIDSYYALELFVRWMREAGDDFPEPPGLRWVHDLLHDESMPPNARLEMAWQLRGRPQWEDWDGDPDPEAPHG
jgi:hypothetical protein